ncbi:hypothetical protein SAMN05428947_10535 [Mucilaginibacter sp. OK283]|jgi:hypothetical protein|nr:hypothetical protein SAMN05428947_10535 [Mucilaginibacter sp. OK283]
MILWIQSLTLTRLTQHRDKLGEAKNRFSYRQHSGTGYSYSITLKKPHDFVKITDYRDFWTDTNLMKPINF